MLQRPEWFHKSCFTILHYKGSNNCYKTSDVEKNIEKCFWAGQQTV